MYGADRRPISYSVDDCLRLVAGVDSAGRPTRWLSTGAIFLALYGKSRRAFTSWMPNALPATGADWEAYLDSMVARDGPLGRLDSAVQQAEAVLGRRPGGYEVAIMAPYPDPGSDTLRFSGTLYDFHTGAGRAGAVRAYLRELVHRFPSAGFQRLQLRGVYWLREGIAPEDTSTVRATADVVHAAGLRFLWIPYFRARGIAGWRRLGFDEIWYQPNYFFHPEIGPARMDSAWANARRFGAGLEIELDRRLLTDTLFRHRLDPYLQLLEDHPEARAGSIAIYEGAGALIDLSRSRRAEDRALYERFLWLVGQD
ncbi:MAG: DUF4855 domain-containing protein [Gemmatimonadales bacterium]